MNNERRKVLNDCYSKLELIRDQIENIKTDVEQVKDDEQEAYDNMPESLQNGERGDIATQAIDNMESFISAAEEFAEAINFIDEAAA